MSQSDSDVSVDTPSTIEIAHRRTGLTPSGSLVTTPCAYVTGTRAYLHQPQTQPQQQPSRLPRHYATLHDHADLVMRAEHADNDVITSRHGRRGSFALGLRPAREDEAPDYSRNPVMPQRIDDNTTPPTMRELVRRSTTEDDSSSTRRSSLVQSDAVFSRPSTRRSSTAGTEVDSPTRKDGNSIGRLARCMTRKVPGIMTHQPSTEKASHKIPVQDDEEPEDASSSQSSRKAHNLSFQLPSGLKMKNPLEVAQKPSPVVGESPIWESPDKPTLPAPRCGGLAARRQVKMDLTLPSGLPDLSKASNRIGPHSTVLSSITPSRPRSPKTPWIHENELSWDRDSKPRSAKTAPIAEEDSTPISTMDIIILNDAGVELGVESALPSATSPLAPPSFVRPPQKIRDRCYISRPTTKRNKSGGLSTSESSYGSTSDGYQTPGVEAGMTEQEERAQRGLFQLAKASKTSRARRWPWNRSKTSGSDEQTQIKHERSDSCKNISSNIFKRSNRFPEAPGKEKKEKISSKSMGAPWRRDKPMHNPPLPSASLANMPVPPTFVPPGCEKVPTPIIFDSVSEVQGKLADFFFETNGFPSAKRKPKASPCGYWDSNAVLMSMHTDLGLSNNEDEEGPEGRPPPAAFHFGPVNDTPGPMISPGLYTGPDGYLTAKDPLPRPLPSTPGTQDSWFRMHFGDYTPNEETFTAAALKESDERRKFEWLIPEHLPNSPLCPLHVKYVGPSKGLCYWHGRKSNGWGVEPGRDYISDPVKIGEGSGGGWEVGRTENPKDRRRERRLESLSDPS